MAQKVRSEIKHYLSFRLGRETYALDVGNAREIVECSTVTQIPKTPPWIRGVINLRGKVVPVIDLKMRFGMGATEETVHTCVIVVEAIAQGEMFVVGMLADAAKEVFELDETDMDPPPRFGVRLATHYIRGMARRGDDLLVILDAERVFSLADMEEAQEAVLGRMGTKRRLKPRRQTSSNRRLMQSGEAPPRTRRTATLPSKEREMLKNTKMAIKVGGGFGLVLVLLAVVAFVGYQGTGSVAGRAGNLVKLDGMIIAQSEAGNHQQAYMATKAEEDATKLKAASESVDKTAEELKAAFQDVEDDKRMDNVLEASARYRGSFGDYLAATNKQKEATNQWVIAGGTIVKETDTALATFQRDYAALGPDAKADVLKLYGDRLNRSLQLSADVFAMRLAGDAVHTEFERQGL